MTELRKAKTQPDSSDAKDKLLAMYRAQPAKVISFGVLLAALAIVVVVNVFFRNSKRASIGGGTSVLIAPRTARAAGGGRPAPKAWRYREVAATWAEDLVLIERINRDPFQVDMTWFPLNPNRRQTSTVRTLLRDGQGGDPLTRHIRQWAGAVDRRRRARESRTASVKAAANSLKLSTVMVSGRNSLAVINGQALKVGEKVNDFTVLRIEPGRVVVNKDGVPVVLVLDK